MYFLSSDELSNNGYKSNKIWWRSLFEQNKITEKERFQKGKESCKKCHK